MLILRASANERRDEVDMLLRVLGNSEDAAATALSLEQDRQLRNPALRWLCHLVWRTGVELQPEVVLRIVIVIALIIPLALFILGLFVGTAFVVFAIIIGWFIFAQRAARRRTRSEEHTSELQSLMRRSYAAFCL